MSGSHGRPDSEDSDEELAEFERLGRRAGAELRRQPPPGGAGAVLGSASHRRAAKATSVVAVSALIVAGVVILIRRPESAPTPSTPAAASSTIVSTETTSTEIIEPRRIELRGHTGLVIAMDAASSSNVVATGGEDGTVRAWDPSNGALLRTVSLDRGQVIDDVAVSADGARFAAHQADGRSTYWRIDDGGTAEPFSVRWDDADRQVSDGTFANPDASMQVVTGAFNRATLVDATTGDEITTFPGAGRSYVAAWSRDGSLVAVRFGGNVKIWRVDTFDELQIIDTPEYRSTSEHLQFLPGDDRIAISVEQIVIVEAVTPIPSIEAGED